jgi:hypothetical protein
MVSKSQIKLITSLEQKKNRLKRSVNLKTPQVALGLFRIPGRQFPPETFED